MSKTVRNVIRKTPHCIALSVVKIKVTPIGSTKSSRQGPKIKIILSIQKKDYKKKFKEVNISGRGSANQKAKYLKYEKFNKYLAKKNTPKEETFILYDTSDSNSSSSREAENSPDKDDKTSIAYDSEYADNEKNSNSSFVSKE